MKCDIDFKEELWNGISEEARELVQEMTKKNPAQRISVQNALSNPWFNKDFSTSQVLIEAQKKMKKYQIM